MNDSYVWPVNWYSPLSHPLFLSLSFVLYLFSSRPPHYLSQAYATDGPEYWVVSTISVKTATCHPGPTGEWLMLSSEISVWPRTTAIIKATRQAEVKWRLFSKGWRGVRPNKRPWNKQPNSWNENLTLQTFTVL